MAPRSTPTRAVTARCRMSTRARPALGPDPRVEAQLQAEVTDLMAKAEAADQADLPDGMSIPEELARREKRLAEIARAKAVIEARAKERHARELAEYEEKLAARGAKK